MVDKKELKTLRVVLILMLLCLLLEIL